MLRPGGRLVALTPNAFDLFAMAGRLRPGARASFRLNRPPVIARALAEAGFRAIRVEALDEPDAYGHLPILSRIESAWHRAARRRPALRGQLLIEAEA